MWVHQEQIDGRNLTDIINQQHENVKYLPNILLPDNVTAVPDLLECVRDAHVLVFVLPHQFVPSIVDALVGHIAPNCRALSLVKGFTVEGGKLVLISNYIKERLGIECSTMSGANVAEGVAREEFSETTLGYASYESARVLIELMDRPYFKVNALRDSAGVELCGCLKNVVALAAGFVDGLGLGTNTKAAILRIGFNEMRRFCVLFDPSCSEEVFLDSSGLADLLTSAYGGRNRRAAEAFVRAKGSKTWDQLERELLRGQKLQGVQSARDVHFYLSYKQQRANFPLFTAVYDICDRNVAPSRIIDIFMTTTTRPIVMTSTPIKAML